MPTLVVASLFSLQCSVFPWRLGFFQGGHAKSNPSHPCSNIARIPPSCSFLCTLVPAFHRLLTYVTCFPSDRFVAGAIEFFKPAIGATKSEISNFSAINVASSWSIEPETGMLEFLHIVYQSHTAWFTSENLDERFLMRASLEFADLGAHDRLLVFQYYLNLRLAYSKKVS